MTGRALLSSALYTGTVAHCRMKPRTHAFRYRAYWLLFDLDELPQLDGRLRLFSYNRWNIFSLYDRDHASGDGGGLRAELDQQLRDAGIDLEGGAIRMLCMPRILGFVFNPLSVHFCYGRSGELRAILYEVHNTFRQRHSYLIGLPASPASGTALGQTCAKRFYVSPFMEMAMTYRFKVRPPSDDIGVIICANDADGPVIVASLDGRRRALTDVALLRQFFAIPFLTAKVVAAIHWQALRLWLKGIRLVPRPAAPSAPVTAIPAKEIAVAE